MYQHQLLSHDLLQRSEISYAIQAPAEEAAYASSAWLRHHCKAAGAEWSWGLPPGRRAGGRG